MIYFFDYKWYFRKTSIDIVWKKMRTLSLVFFFFYFAFDWKSAD